MSTLTRSWLAFAAIGSGLIHLALVVGSPLGLGIVLALLGLVEFGWGVLTFARESVALPRTVLAGALAPVLVWALLLVSATISETPAVAEALPLLPLGIAALFELFIAATIAIHLRRAGKSDAAPTAPGVGRYLLGLALGALVVAALTTPALAATDAGTYAVPHGEHSGNAFDLLPSHSGH